MEKLLEVEKLHVSFSKKGRHIKALNGISLQLGKGSILAVVGESGSGKSTLAMSIMGLLDKENLSDYSGRILFKGADLSGKTAKEMNRIRGAEIGMVFQEPLYALNPAISIGKQIEEQLVIHNTCSKSGRKKRVLEVMEDVGLPEPQKYYDFYPSELSGGMKQRVVIAMALACGPSLILADEPTTALDVTTQAQILSLLRSLKEKKSLSIILITHDLGVVAEMADQVAVVYHGNVLEYGDTASVLKTPCHPYSLGLIKCIPYSDQKQERLYTIPKPDNSTLTESESSCCFYPRCFMARPQCASEAPALADAGSGHLARCPFKDEVKL